MNSRPQPWLNWPHNWFGIFRTHESEPSQFPYIQEFIDPEWDSQLDVLCRFLDEAPVVLASATPHVPCPLCGAHPADPGCYHSDGVWLWPASLSHEVRCHHVRLPDAFTAHILAKRTPPPKLETEMQDLPWPRMF